MKAYLKSRPQQLDWEKVDIGNIGCRLVEKDQKQYLGKQVAEWDLDLKPRPNHFDSGSPSATPLQKAGAYLLVAKMDGGNTSRIVAVGGRHGHREEAAGQGSRTTSWPTRSRGSRWPRRTWSSSGTASEWIQDDPNGGHGHYQVDTQDFAEFTDADGQLHA